MKSTKKKGGNSPELKDRLSQLEQELAQRGIHLHYDLLEAAGLKLKDGICQIRGEYHLFVDRRKSSADKIEILRDYLNHPLPDDISEVDEQV
ncbi:MAG: hypothetical protein HQ561_11580 [Desulfobacteraceae bacterium]|nr:hypothetical protein [Desulfobacteraceae bacterium]